MRKALMLVLVLVLLVAFASQSWAVEKKPAHHWEEDDSLLPKIASNFLDKIISKVQEVDRIMGLDLVPSSECPPPCVEIYHWGRGERVCVCGQMQ